MKFKEVELNKIIRFLEPKLKTDNLKLIEIDSIKIDSKYLFFEVEPLENCLINFNDDLIWQVERLNYNKNNNSIRLRIDLELIKKHALN